MTPQSVWQTIVIYILPNISRSKDKQTMNVGQLIEYKKINISLQTYADNEAVIQVLDLFSFFRNAQGCL